MLRSIWNSTSGLYSNQTRIDAISNNIANINTNGYKRVDVNFSDILVENVNRLGVPVTENEKEKFVGSGSRISGFIRDDSQGIIEKSDRNLDFAIEGRGYFRLIDSKGNELYTRKGNFYIDANNNLVDSNGNKLDISLNTKDNIDYDKISVKENGEILYNENIIGKIDIYDFDSEDNLYPIGNSLFKGINPKSTNSSIKQGYVEKSNVDISKELTDLLVTQRAFELNSRALKTSEEMWQMTNNLRSK
ncbi:MAG: flagellar hook-basal body complex protein [Caloramator sp.]|jgi:flagellar basal-body rod protein FlgG|uniref:flagellar hook-basal body complex protein n=1 Tax=Caloramator sp. TaxID=1871330 RepID=UPI001DB50431|nr:flagellar hook-basal body complex protein [Caloramator sp.]MBZ4663082.1 flagellar hook-basal body complex protein [Caloramator sp.]